MISLSEELRNNSYPGRGILIGCSPDGRKSVAAYFIMGRSENSRNRIFVSCEDGIRTEAYDLSKMTDPSLIIYHPLRILDQTIILTNGDQTDTILEGLRSGLSVRDALLSRKFEPDAPSYTPRISGVIQPDGSYCLSILKSLEGDPSCCCRFFYEYDTPRAGTGHFLHTYRGDGSPLPSFEGEPRAAALPETAQELADLLWSSLNEENKVSLYVQYTDRETWTTEKIIRNKHSEAL